MLSGDAETDVTETAPIRTDPDIDEDTLEAAPAPDSKNSDPTNTSSSTAKTGELSETLPSNAMTSVAMPMTSHAERSMATDLKGRFSRAKIPRFKFNVIKLYLTIVCYR